MFPKSVPQIPMIVPTGNATSSLRATTVAIASTDVRAPDALRLRSPRC